MTRWPTLSGRPSTLRSVHRPLRTRSPWRRLPTVAELAGMTRRTAPPSVSSRPSPPTSTFLGTSSGLRLRHDQPTGRLELNAKSADLARSAWAGVSTRDFRGVDVLGLEAELAQRLEWARRTVELPAGRYETLLPPSAVSDLMIYLY